MAWAHFLLCDGAQGWRAVLAPPFPWTSAVPGDFSPLSQRSTTINELGYCNSQVTEAETETARD